MMNYQDEGKDEDDQDDDGDEDVNSEMSYFISKCKCS